MTVADILRWLAETSLAVSVLVLLILVIRKPFAKAFGARAAYALWLAPVVRLFLPELKLLPAPPAPEINYTQTVEQVFYAMPAASVAPVQSFELGSIIAASALVIWATVAFAWFNLRLEAQARFMRERKAASEPASPAVTALASEIAERMNLRRLPAIRISNDRNIGPCLIGLLRPVIFLPDGFEKDYAAAEQRLALAHELAHIARGDMAASLVALALQAMQWPNPLAHFCYGVFRTDQEAACDAYVLARFSNGSNAAGDYAAAIMKSVRAGATAPAYGLSLAHPVKERLMLLKDKKKSPLRLMTGAAAVALFTAGSLAVTASYGHAAEKAETKQTKETKVLEAKAKSKMVVELDAGDKFEGKGISNKAKKIEITDENGERTVRMFDANGKLLSENIIGPDDAMPFQEVIIVDKDGKKKTLTLASPKGEMHKMMFLGKDGDVKGPHKIMVEMMGEDGAVWSEDGEHIVRLHKEGGDGHMMRFVTADGGGAHFIGDCAGEGDEKGAMVWNWTDEDTDGENTFVTKEVICLNGDDAATPEKRAEALRKVISRMEDEAKRQQELISKMKDELKKAEKEAKK